MNNASPRFDFNNPDSYEPPQKFDFANPEQDESTGFQAPQESGVKRFARDILAGLAEGGRRTSRLPVDLIKRIEELGQSTQEAMSQFPGQKLGMEYEKPISEHVEGYINKLIPSDINYAQALGQKGEGTLLDQLVQGGASYAPELMGAGGLLKSGLKKFPFTQKMAASKLKQAERMIGDAGIEVPLSGDLIGEAKPFLPKTYATNEMLQGAAEGGYKPSFATQSQVGAHERNLRKSPLASERLLAPQARELKQTMLAEMETQLRDQGYGEAADLLKGGIDDYRKYVKIRDNVFPILKKIGVPTSALAVIGFGYKKGSELLKD